MYYFVVNRRKIKTRPFISKQMRFAIIFDPAEYTGDLKELIDFLIKKGGQRADFWKSNDSKFWNSPHDFSDMAKTVHIISSEFDQMYVLSNKRTTFIAIKIRLYFIKYYLAKLWCKIISLLLRWRSFYFGRWIGKLN